MAQKTGIINREPPNVGAPGEEVTIAGHDMKRVDMRDTLHQAMAYAQQHPGDNMMNPGPPPPSREAKTAVDEAVPEYVRSQEHTEQIDGLDPQQSDIAHTLAQRIVEAKTEGRTEAANELQNLLGQLMGATQPKRKRVPKEVHPALQRLRQNLGLQRIPSVTVEWCGSKWHFAPPPPALDQWVAQTVDQGVGSYSALKLASALVGLDDAPLYEVFNIDTKAEFIPPDGSDTITVRLYEKRCDACGDIIDVDAKECESCGSLHDPFDMPLILRVRCAEQMNQYFAEEFGPYEDLGLLLTKLREQMPDRTVSKEKLYPFPELLPTSSSEMDTTPTGAKPSSD